MKKSLAIPLLFFIIVGGKAFSLTWSMNAKTVAFNYSGSTVTSNQSITIKRDNSSGKVYFYLLISSASLGSALPGERRVYLNGASEYESSMAIFIRPASGNTEVTTLNEAGSVVLIGSMNNGVTSDTVNFKVVTASGRVPQGVYSNIFSVQIFSGTNTPPNGIAESIGTLTININATQVATMTMGFSNNSIGDFGTMQAGNSYTASLTMTVTAGTNFSISAFSKNGGKLVLTVDETIGYSFYFNNSSVATDLTNGTVKLITSTTSVVNKAYNLQFVTETLAFAEAGQYTDSLYLMFTTS